MFALLVFAYYTGLHFPIERIFETYTVCLPYSCSLIRASQFIRWGSIRVIPSYVDTVTHTIQLLVSHRFIRFIMRFLSVIEKATRTGSAWVHTLNPGTGGWRDGCMAEQRNGRCSRFSQVRNHRRNERTERTRRREGKLTDEPPNWRANQRTNRRTEESRH